MVETEEFELVIVGGGPAGLTAGLYASRSSLKAVLLDKGAVGGQLLNTSWIDNYPGFPEGISGFDLVDKMAAQARRFGLETMLETVVSMNLKQPLKMLVFESGREISTQTLIIATGSRPNKLGVPGESEFTGKGVSYCATCDGPFYRDMDVAVVGGGNTAIHDAIYLTRFARKVTVIHRRDQLRATRIYQDEAFANSKIKFIWNSSAVAIEGSDGVERLRIRNKEGEEKSLAVQGVFVLIGTTPNNEMLPRDQLELDEKGFIVTDQEMRTGIPGVMAAGDIRSKAVQQVASAVGEGAVAEQSVEEYLAQLS